MKRFLLQIAILSLFSSLYAYTDIDSGDVSGVWTKENSPYNIYGDLHVNQNQKLTLEPGVKVVFHGHYRIYLSNASLFALGSPEDSIVFTMADTAGFANGAWDEGGWNGIGFSYPSSNGDTSHFGYCRFEYAKLSGPDPQTDLGLIGAEALPRLVIRDCIFENNKTRHEGLIHIKLSDLIIRNNVFLKNEGAKIISMTEDSPDIYWNRFDSNTVDVPIWITGWNHPRIHHNMFIRNTSHHVIKVEGNCRPWIFQNWILNNHSVDLISFYESNTYFINNLIANNDGSINLFSDESVIIHNTIVNNKEYGIHLNNSANLINGNIFNGNENPIMYTPGENREIIRYNMFDFDSTAWAGQGPEDIYEYNAENQSPHFVINPGGIGSAFDAEFADFNIAPQAHVVNQGDPYLPDEYILPDLYDGQRIRFGRIDFGAYEAYAHKDTMPVSIFQDTIVIADTIIVTDNIYIPDDITLKIYAGAKVLFLGYDSIAIKGNIEAIGTETDPIWFSVQDTTGFYLENPDSGAWKGIVIDNDDGSMDYNDPSIFEHCIFEYVKHITTPDMDAYRGGALTVRNWDDVILRNCEFRYNYSDQVGHAIYARDSDFDLINCSFHHHFERDIFTMGTVSLIDSRHRIDQCTFYDNKSYDGSGLYVFDCDIDLRSSHFYNNSTVHTGIASCLSARGCNVSITNCLFNNNWCNNTGIMYFTSSTAEMNNTTLVNNLTPWPGTTAGISLVRTNMTIRNSILYGNTCNADSTSIMLMEDSSDPHLINTLIQGGVNGIKTLAGFSFTGELEDCIDGNPFFKRPSPHSGLVENAGSWDWRLLDVSPCINAGIADTNGLGLPEFDLAGRERVIYDVVDLGAYENYGKAPFINSQPMGRSYCAGDSIILNVTYSHHTDSAFQQWQKDGVDIPGAVNNELVLYPAQQDHTGNYISRVQNSFGTVYSLPVFISVKDPPEILIQPDNEWVEPGKSVTLEVQLTGSFPMEIDWSLDGENLGVDVPAYKFIPADSSMEGIYQCNISNDCGTVSTEPVSIYLAPQLCMVTVSTATGHNLVVWEKKTKAPITAYNVYRESSAAGIYDRLVTLPADELSVFVDTVADPTVQGYIYKVTAVDTSGYETDADLCEPHKTIHLLVSTNPELNTTQLEWDRYVGFDYLTYKIYRSNTTTDLQEVHALSSSFNSWTDPDPVAGKQYYRIAVEKPVPCVPEGVGIKAGTGPYQHALSNMDDNKLKTGLKTFELRQKLLIFPNPVGSMATLKFPNPEHYPFQLTISSLDGKALIMKQNIRSDILTVKTENLPRGCYIFELRGTRIYRGIGIVE